MAFVLSGGERHEANFLKPFVEPRASAACAARTPAFSPLRPGRRQRLELPATASSSEHQGRHSPAFESGGVNRHSTADRIASTTKLNASLDD